MNIVITGENGYIATNLKKYLSAKGEQIYCSSFRNGADGVNCEETDVIIHCAAIVHKKESDYKDLYYKVNYTETVRLAQKAKKAGVRHFIFISTMSVYGLSNGEINADTICNPISLYGKSKLAAEKEILALAGDDFKITIVRPPMVYGLNCPGNFGLLKELAVKTPIFPKVNNKRSMIYIENLVYIIHSIIKDKIYGIILPTDKEYVNTSYMVKKIAECNGKKIYLSKLLGKIAELMPFNIFKKVFGSLYYNTDIAMLCDHVEFNKAIEKSVNKQEDL